MFAPFRTFARKLRRFGRARRGVTALEFALVLPPFLLLTVGLAEVAMIGLAQTSLDFAVTETARQIRTGEAQNNGWSASEIENRICDKFDDFLVVDCASNISIDVRHFSSFVDASNNLAAPIDNGQFDPSGLGYAPGVASDIVVVRAYYRWDVLTPMFERVFGNLANGDRILVSTMMFRTEPYG